MLTVIDINLLNHLFRPMSRVFRFISILNRPATSGRRLVIIICFNFVIA